jgi:hypothetical protein
MTTLVSSGANLLGVLGVLPYGPAIGLVISLRAAATDADPETYAQVRLVANDAVWTRAA